MNLISEQRLRYVAVKPTASITKLRQKIWHLLDLPDYCDEIVILKSSDEKDLPLTALCNGNDPQHPYILEVWLPERFQHYANFNYDMITMGDQNTELNDKVQQDIEPQRKVDQTPPEVVEAKLINNIFHIDHKRSDLSYKVSNASLFFQIPGNKGTDNFACILLKIQNDLSTLSNKLSQLESKINY